MLLSDNLTDSSPDTRSPPQPEQEQAAATTPSSPKKRDLANEALEKLKKTSDAGKIVPILEEFAHNSKNSDGTRSSMTVPELLDGMKKLRDQNAGADPRLDETDRNLWEKLKIKERITQAINVLKPFMTAGDVVATFDPVHAALPWAAVRFVLVVRKVPVF